MTNDLAKKSNVLLGEKTEELIGIQSDTKYNPAANPHYYRTLYYLTKTLRPSVVVEFGTWKGVSAACLYDGYPNARVRTIDTLYQVVPDARREGIEYKIFSANVVDDLPAIDIAFIDVEHTYECTTMCLDMIRDKMASNSIILFDDIFLNEDMKAFWDELNIGGEKVFLPIHGDAGFGMVVYNK